MSPTKASPCAVGALPRGPHKLGREAVLASQRARMLEAMLELVGSQGYSATTVPQVVAGARASRNAFYELFEDKEACFLAMCEEEATHFSDAVLQAAIAAPNWRTAVGQAIHEVLSWWQARPALARAFLIEIPTVGERATRARQAAYRPFEHLLTHATALAQADGAAMRPLGKHVVHMLVSGITDTIAEEVRSGRGNKLTRLQGELTAAVITLLERRDT